MLEIARRYKITNPEKMRSEYGKLVYLMQDAVSPEIKPLLGVDISTPIYTVYSLLEQAGGTAILDDPVSYCIFSFLPNSLIVILLHSTLAQLQKRFFQTVKRVVLPFN